METLKFLLSSKSLCLARTFIATSEHLVQLKDSCVFSHLNGRGRLILTGPIGKNLFFAGFEIALCSKDSLDNWWKTVWIRSHPYSLYMHATASRISYNTKISGQNQAKPCWDIKQFGLAVQRVKSGVRYSLGTYAPKEGQR